MKNLDTTKINKEIVLKWIAERGEVLIIEVPTVYRDITQALLDERLITAFFTTENTKSRFKIA